MHGQNYKDIMRMFSEVIVLQLWDKRRFLLLPYNFICILNFFCIMPVLP